MREHGIRGAARPRRLTQAPLEVALGYRQNRRGAPEDVSRTAELREEQQASDGAQRTRKRFHKNVGPPIADVHDNGNASRRRVTKRRLRELESWHTAVHEIRRRKGFGPQRELARDPAVISNPR